MAAPSAGLDDATLTRADFVRSTCKLLRLAIDGLPGLVHSLRVLHRDLSTKNIFLSAPGCDGDVRAAKPHSGGPLAPAAQRSPLP